MTFLMAVKENNCSTQQSNNMPSNISIKKKVNAKQVNETMIGLKL